MADRTAGNRLHPATSRTCRTGCRAIDFHSLAHRLILPLVTPRAGRSATISAAASRLRSSGSADQRILREALEPLADEVGEQREIAREISLVLVEEALDARPAGLQ